MADKLLTNGRAYCWDEAACEDVLRMTEIDVCQVWFERLSDGIG